MSDLGDLFNAHKKDRQDKRRKNREKSAEILAEKKVWFESRNMGAHLIVEGKDCLIDYWPGTGRWISREGRRGFGIKSLLRETPAQS